MFTTELITEINKGTYDQLITDIYIDVTKLEYQKKRYINAINSFAKEFGDDDVSIFSAPGRSEIGGNHTDHQHGQIIAASINNDAIAIAKPLTEALIKIVSDGYDMIVVELDSLEIVEDEKETTIALIRGVLAKLKENGHNIGGFQAYITSDVLVGAGLSSSAAFETLIGTIISGFYNGMGISAVELAKVGQYAENVYFGKPCGLMDQMACSVGSLVYIDFANPNEPVVEKIDFDMNLYGYSLCITDTKGSHADLTADYAAVPQEMKMVASYFGQDVLLGISCEDVISNISDLRKTVGDRAVLRALHFISENERVVAEVKALKSGSIDDFLQLVNDSGNSSYKYLQNIYSNSDILHQNISLALCVSEITLGNNGVCRVHGGGFAGTIQAFVKNEAVSDYKENMNRVFGEGACSVLKIRQYGGMKVI